MCGTVDSVTIYPLTGARGIACEEATLDTGGFTGDHEYVLYETGPDGGFERVSQKQCRMLAQVAVRPIEDFGLYVERDPELVAAEGARPWGMSVPLLAQASFTEIIEVNEFGDLTQCHDMGHGPAQAFTGLLQREVRLARKTRTWLAGEIVIPKVRNNATIHVALAETVEYLADQLPRNPDGERPFGPDRLRAQLVVSGFPQFADKLLVGGRLVVNDTASINLDRDTLRCQVPGNNQRTGQKMGDFPRVYPHAPRDETGRKPVIGVYGHAVGKLPTTVRRGDSVRWIKG
jgi:uncharacterized protein YcbX